MSLEQKIQYKILKYLNSLKRCVAWKIVVANERGIPDILFFYGNKRGGIEVKRPGEQPTAIQEEQMKRIIDDGGIAFYASSVEEVKEKLHGRPTR